MIDQGLVSYLEGFVSDRRKALFKTILANRTRHFTVVLEDVYHPHNASAVVRTCDIFGVQDLHTIENRNINKVSRHVAKGSQKWITHHRYKEDGNNTNACLDSLRNSGYQLIATTPHNDSCVLQNVDIHQKTAFVFGGEATGISDEVIQQADGFLKIPMVGFGESLNISVATAIILQDVTNRLRNSNIAWQLTPDEQAYLYLNWIEKTIKNSEEIKQRYFASTKEI